MPEWPDTVLGVGGGEAGRQFLSYLGFPPKLRSVSSLRVHGGLSTKAATQLLGGCSAPTLLLDSVKDLLAPSMALRNALKAAATPTPGALGMVRSMLSSLCTGSGMCLGQHPFICASADEPDGGCAEARKSARAAAGAACHVTPAHIESLARQHPAMLILILPTGGPLDAWASGHTAPSQVVPPESLHQGASSLTREPLQFALWQQALCMQADEAVVSAFAPASAAIAAGRERGTTYWARLPGEKT